MRKRIPHDYIKDENGNLIEVKYCKPCDKWKQLDEFNSKQSSYDGKETQCKECTRKKSAKFRDKNKDYDREYQQKNFPKLKEYKRQYYLKKKAEKESEVKALP
jgi:hypothetical protein